MLRFQLYNIFVRTNNLEAKGYFIMKLGAQFYSIRTKTTTPADLKASFKAMRDIGYQNAQMSAICKMDPYELAVKV